MLRGRRLTTENAERERIEHGLTGWTGWEGALGRGEKRKEFRERGEAREARELGMKRDGRAITQ